MKKLPAYRVYLITEFTVAIFFAMIFVASGVYQVTTVGLDPLQLVLVGTTLELSAFLGEVPTGVVADAYSRRLSIIIGYVLIGAGFAGWRAKKAICPAPDKTPPAAKAPRCFQCAAR